jgi:hypothetical protein
VSQLVTYNSWSLDAPAQWRVTEHPECITLERGSEGALQLSSATKKTGAISHEELVAHAESQNDGWGEATSTTCGEFEGVLFQYTDDDMQCNRWFLRNRATLLFVTYFASTRAQLLEHPEVQRILATLRATAA